MNWSTLGEFCSFTRTPIVDETILRFLIPTFTLNGNFYR